MTRIARLFKRLHDERRAALIAYLTAGDPSMERTASLVHALVRGGADLIELGVPFSDPIADGPVIQRASERALRQGANLRAVLGLAREIRESSDVPILLFTYLNPVVRLGIDTLAPAAVESGIDGCLFTDLSVEEARPYLESMRNSGLDTVFLAAPTSSEERLRLVAKYSTGFVYLVARAGVTGEQASLSDSVAPLVDSMRRVTDLPLAVGFGISKPEHAATVGSIADGVVVGSAFVRIIEEHGDSPELEGRLEGFARNLFQALPKKD